MAESYGGRKVIGFFGIHLDGDDTLSCSYRVELRCTEPWQNRMAEEKSTGFWEFI